MGGRSAFSAKGAERNLQSIVVPAKEPVSREIRDPFPTERCGRGGGGVGGQIQRAIRAGASALGQHVA